MEDELKQQDVPFGMLLVQGGCLPQQVRAFVQAAQGDEPLALNDEQDEDIKFRVLPAASVPLAVEKVSHLVLVSG